MTHDPRPAGILTRSDIALGCVCAGGILTLLFSMLQHWQFMNQFVKETGTTDFTQMFAVCPGPVGQLGTYAYLAAWIWLPTVAWRLWRARRDSLSMRDVDRVLPAVVAILVVAVQCLLRLTVLRGQYPRI